MTDDPVRVAAGYKATLHNPNSSDEAKEHARKVLEEMGIEWDEVASTSHKHKDPSPEAQLRGLKAALHNPHVSDAAKENAQVKINNLEAKVHPENVTTGGDTDSKTVDVHEHRVVGGLKAALHNPVLSDETKESVKQKLTEHGVDLANV